MFDSVVTGAAGFVGSHLTERLLERGDRVLGVDSFDDYYGRRQKTANLSSVRRHPRFRLVEADVRRVRWSRYLDRETRLYHLAGQPGVRGSWGIHFGRYLENNVLATQHLLESVARSARVRRIVYSSSSSIYGDQPPGATPESALPNPISPYGMTKLAAEHLVRSYASAYGLPVVSTRFFTVYGPRQRPDMAFHRFFRAVASGRSIEIYGDGRQMRDFTYVGDIVEGVLLAGDTDTKEPVFNLGRGSPVRLSKALEEIERVSGRRVRVRHLPRPRGDPASTWSDTRLARRVLGYRPRVDLREGLARQWKWHQERRAGAILG